MRELICILFWKISYMRETCISEFGSDVCDIVQHVWISMITCFWLNQQLSWYNTHSDCQLQINMIIMCCRALIAGGGAPETELGLKLAHYAQTITGVDAYCFRLVFSM
jgi:hypothetical protein